MKIIADDKIPYLKGVFEPVCTIEYYPGKDITPEIVKDADALITRTRTKCNEALLKGSGVKFIATATIGYDHIDTDYCKRNGISWTNAPGCNSSSVLQYIAAALAHLTNTYQFDLQERTLGIVGVGNVGTKVTHLLDTLDCRVYLNDPPRMRNEGLCGFVSLDSILRECDIITFHVPLTKEGEDKTYHLADTSFFNRLNPGTIIINSSRGEVVDNIALEHALDSGKVAAAVLDVWENEPKIRTSLLEKTAIATPHIAGYSADGKANGTTMSVQAVSRFFKLGLDDWIPSDIPQPKNTHLELDCSDKSFQQVFNDLILQTYPIYEDDKRLRDAVQNFEQLRANYPLRREFDTYFIKLVNDSRNFGKKLRKIGFHVLTE